MLGVVLVVGLLAVAAVVAAEVLGSRRQPPARARFDPVEVEDVLYRGIYGARSGRVHLVEREAAAEVPAAGADDGPDPRLLLRW